MVRDPDVLVRLQRLQTEIAVDISALRERERETGDLVRRWDAAGSIGRPEVALLAVNLHAWYTAFESLLERWRVSWIRRFRRDRPGTTI